MKPFAFVVKQNETEHSIHYSLDDAKRYHSWVGSKFPITELYERSTKCVKESFDAGYNKALIDLQALSIAVDLLKDFGQSIGGSSSFWEEDYDDSFDTMIFELQNKIIRACSGYKEDK